MIETDVLVIGAGPIGLEMAVGLKDAGVEYIHIEAKQIGQTISWFPRQCRFFSSPDRIAICGVPLMTADQSKATREEYLAYLRERGLRARGINHSGSSPPAGGTAEGSMPNLLKPNEAGSCFCAPVVLGIAPHLPISSHHASGATVAWHTTTPYLFIFHGVLCITRGGGCVGIVTDS